MSKRFWIPIGLLLLASAGPPLISSQDGDTTPPKVTLDAAQEECDALIDEVDEAVSAWISDYRAKAKEAKEAGTPAPAFSWNDSPIGDFVEKFQAKADDYAGNDSAIPFLAWMAAEGSRADVELAKAAVETICIDHGDSEALAPHAPKFGDWIYIVGKERAAELLADLEENSSVPTIVGWAVYHRVQPAFGKAEAGTDAYKAMKAELLAASANAKSDRLTALINKKIDLQEKFGLGAIAPDIQGLDLDGTEFALSDYKGKIIFLDFWGDW